MEKFVFEADIIVPRLEMKRHRFELTRVEMEQLLNGVLPLPGFSDITVDELRDLIRGEGEKSSYVRLQGAEQLKQQLLIRLAAEAWLNDIPWTITQSTDHGLDDPRFDKLVSAAVVDV
jgi:hypothetical protein